MSIGELNLYICTMLSISGLNHLGLQNHVLWRLNSSGLWNDILWRTEPHCCRHNHDHFWYQLPASNDTSQSLMGDLLIGYFANTSHTNASPVNYLLIRWRIHGRISWGIQGGSDTVQIKKNVYLNYMIWWHVRVALIAHVLTDVFCLDPLWWK